MHMFTHNMHTMQMLLSMIHLSRSSVGHNGSSVDGATRLGGLDTAFLITYALSMFIRYYTYSSMCDHVLYVYVPVYMHTWFTVLHYVLTLSCA